jgi:hypothetical protein
MKPEHEILNADCDECGHGVTRGEWLGMPIVECGIYPYEDLLLMRPGECPMWTEKGESHELD